MAQSTTYNVRVTKLKLEEDRLRNSPVKATFVDEGYSSTSMEIETNDPELTKKLQKTGKRFTLILVEQPDLPEEKEDDKKDEKKTEGVYTHTFTTGNLSLGNYTPYITNVR